MKLLLSYEVRVWSKYRGSLGIVWWERISPCTFWHQQPTRALHFAARGPSVPLRTDAILCPAEHYCSQQGRNYPASSNESAYSRTFSSLRRSSITKHCFSRPSFFVLGGYFSYLFARMYAGQIWQKHFAVDPLNRLGIDFFKSIFWITNYTV